MPTKWRSRTRLRWPGVLAYEGLAVVVLIVTFLLRRLVGVPVDVGFLWTLAGVFIGAQILLFAVAYPFLSLPGPRGMRRHGLRNEAVADPSHLARDPEPEAAIIETPQGRLRHWNWQLRESGAGPDHVACLQFRDAAEERLEAAVKAAGLAGFRAYRHLRYDGVPCLTYIDETHAAQFAANLRGARGGNIWVYAAIEISRGVILLENGYGGGKPHCAVQTGMLHHLLTQETGLTLVHWSIHGTESRGTWSGQSAEDLLDYLRAVPEPEVHGQDLR